MDDATADKSALQPKLGLRTLRLSALQQADNNTGFGVAYNKLCSGAMKMQGINGARAMFFLAGNRGQPAREAAIIGRIQDFYAEIPSRGGYAVAVGPEAGEYGWGAWPIRLLGPPA